ncbi:Ankyrin repeat domain containing protein [Echinococcus multilocularis]|uniref:Ankyrin repeat domain containing protein n=1 Tax=Echinococcus multilocularis TaxID=6211 RepID=A0A068Y6J7_ECHMU|nr:Ankyrin repeat domain containing protein [Echinococcus multilocularis]
MSRPGPYNTRALREAIAADKSAVVEFLLQQGVDPNVPDREDSEPPLLLAAMCGSHQAMHVLLSHGASINAIDRHGNTALHWAAIVGNMNCVTLLLSHGIPINITNDIEVTPLMFAASYEHINIVGYLLQQGASTLPQLNQWNESALTFACYAGDINIVELILAVEVPAEYRSREFYSSLGQAALGRHMDVVQLLLDLKAPVDLQDTMIENPLHLAIRGGNESIIRLLLSQGANIEAISLDGYTPLMAATRGRNVNAVTALLDAGADIYAVNEATGETAFSLAEERGYVEIGSILLGAIIRRNL